MNNDFDPTFWIKLSESQNTSSKLTNVDMDTSPEGINLNIWQLFQKAYYTHKKKTNERLISADDYYHEIKDNYTFLVQYISKWVPNYQKLSNSLDKLHKKIIY